MSEISNEYGLPQDEADEVDKDVEYLISLIRKHNTNPMNILSWKQKTKTRRFRRRDKNV